jgi:hypothetical protein
MLVLFSYTLVSIELWNQTLKANYRQNNVPVTVCGLHMIKVYGCQEIWKSIVRNKCFLVVASQEEKNYQCIYIFLNK